MRRFLLVTAGALLAFLLPAATPVQAYSLFHGISVQAVDQTAGSEVDTSSLYPDDTPSIIDMEAAATSGGSIATAKLDANLETGVIKLGATAVTAPQDPVATADTPSSASGFAELLFTEQFTADGDGTVTFEMAIDGFGLRTNTTNPAFFGENLAQSISLHFMSIYQDNVAPIQDQTGIGGGY